MKFYWSVVGMLLGLVFITLALLTMGWARTLMFALFTAGAIMDGLSGRVHVGLFTPMIIILLVYYPWVAVSIFAPVFGILLFLWACIGILQKRLSSMDPDKCYFGFGDVLGVPLAMAMCQAFLPIWGLVAFAGGMILVTPKWIKKNQIRFLPYLLPGVAGTFVSAMIMTI